MPGVQDGPAPESLDLFVPGRLCLFGEHSDWAGSMRKCVRWSGDLEWLKVRGGPMLRFAHHARHGRYNPDISHGLTLVVTTEQGLFATARRRDDRKLVLKTSAPGASSKSITLDLDDEDGLFEVRQ